MLTGIAAGEWDVAADGITYTAERDQTVDFSQLYQAYDETLLIREGEDRFDSPEALIALGDFMVATQTGTTNAITAEKLFGADHVKTFSDFGAAIEALQNDDADAVVVDRPAAEGYIEAQGGLKTLPQSLAGVEGLAFAYPPGSDLVYPINAAMSALQASGKWDEIYAKWFETKSE
jgi:polar amino acid transport system substrate-binding protein